MREEQGKKKINEVKTFPVPFALEGTEEKITISTNSAFKPSKPSKEEIFKKAFKFHSQGNISEASKYYQYFINQGFKNYIVFFNYGTILKSLGKLQEAENFYRKAIEIKPDLAEAHYNLANTLLELGNLQEAESSIHKTIQIKPDFANAHNNLGNIFREVGKVQEAETSYRKAIELNPNFADAYSNLGNILKELNKLQEAENSYRKAIELNPNYPNVHFNLGTILKELRKPQEALDCYLKTIELAPSYPNIYPIITRFLSESDPSRLNQLQLKEILNLLLEKNNITHNELFITFKFLFSSKTINSLESFQSHWRKEESFQLFTSDKLIIKALKKITFKDMKLEKILTNIRKYFCDWIAENKKEISYSQLEFVIALGEQCFMNEYVYSLTEEENKCINKILRKCKNNELNETYISILSCYFPLYKLLDQIPFLKSFNSSNKNLKELIKLQVSEPLKEIELSQGIKKLGFINDSISQKVKSQYEQNPYPRWRYGNSSYENKFSITQVINNEIKPNLINLNFDDRQLKVLIAGCGTGNQILQSQKYQNAQVTAIDLSLSSLSYAQRKINELRISNVQLIQMDILQISLLNQKFDIIECGGVLHHMDDPSKGLRALLDVLKNNSFLKLGLYSELARQDIIEANEYIKTKNLQPNNDDIKSFRDDVFSGKIEQISNLRNLGNFYTISECRDLCFHAKEHRFTIHKLQETLKSNKLKFLGFLLPQTIKSLYHSYFPTDKEQTNLQNWAKFEDKNPNTFRSMYQFWVCKTKI